MGVKLNEALCQRLQELLQQRTMTQQQLYMKSGDMKKFDPNRKPRSVSKLVLEKWPK